MVKKRRMKKSGALRIFGEYAGTIMSVHFYCFKYFQQKIEKNYCKNKGNML